MKLGILQQKKASGLLLKQHWRQIFVSQGHFLCILQAWQKLLLLLFNEDHFQQMSFPFPFPSTGEWERPTFCIMSDPQSLYQVTVKITFLPKTVWAAQVKAQGGWGADFGICLLPESPTQIPPALVLHLAGIPWFATGKSSQNLVDMVVIKNSLALKSSWGRNGQLSRQQNVRHWYQVVLHEFKN